MLVSLAICGLLAGCQKKITKEEADLLKQMSHQNHQRMTTAMKMMQQKHPQDTYHLEVKGSTSTGWMVIDRPLGVVYKAVLQVLQEADITVDSQSSGGISGEITARLATGKTLRFKLAIVSKNSSKLIISMYKSDCRISYPQIEYLFRQVSEKSLNN